MQLDRLAAEFARRSSPDFAQIALGYLRGEVIMRSRYVEGEVDRAIKRDLTVRYSRSRARLLLRIADRTWRRFYAFLKSIIRHASLEASTPAGPERSVAR